MVTYLFSNIYVLKCNLSEMLSNTDKVQPSYLILMVRLQII
jgi:hypothetical protein